MITITGLPRVDALLDALSELSPADWRTMGRLACTLHDQAAVRLAESLARTVIADRRLDLRLWDALDAMHTCAAVAAGPACAAGRDARALRAASIQAARRALMAELAHDGLSPEDHDLLLAPVTAILDAPPRSYPRAVGDRIP